MSWKRFRACSWGNAMLRPIAGERPACAPWLAASINPGPPPEITEKPASDSRRAIDFAVRVVRMVLADARAAEHADGGMDAVQLVGRGLELCHNPQHPPGLLSVGRLQRWRIDQLGNLVGSRPHGNAIPRRRFVVSCIAHSMRCRTSATSKGEPTGAMRGVLSMLRRLVNDGKPDYFAVVFDAHGKTFRDDWYPEYKANRPPMPDDLVAQIDPLHETVRANGWPLLMRRRRRSRRRDRHARATGEGGGHRHRDLDRDKDLAQLVESGITLINTMSDERSITRA